MAAWQVDSMPIASIVCCKLLSSVMTHPRRPGQAFVYVVQLIGERTINTSELATSLARSLAAEIR